MSKIKSILWEGFCALIHKCPKCGEHLACNDNDYSYGNWYCPNCGNRDHDKLNVARRTCGYIGTNFWNKGRTQEIKERVIHLDNKECC